MFVGDPATLAEATFGPGLPAVAEWTARRFDSIDIGATDAVVAQLIARRLKTLM